MSEVRSEGGRAVKRRRYQEIAEHIELLIYSGDIGDGSRLPSERELMEHFSVGRSTVREALFALQRMGLVTVGSGAPARITRPTPRALVAELSGAARHFLARPEGMRHFQHARALFEIGLAREAALRATPQDLDALAAALAANRAAIGQQAAFERTDLEFHYAIARIAHNPIFTALHDALSEWLSEQRNVSSRAGALAEIVYREHARIADAIVAHDADAAMRAMEEHLAAVVRNYWRAMAPPYAVE